MSDLDFLTEYNDRSQSNDGDENSVESDDEEEECRVCRGPAENGRPLFAPCKCSGSIGLTHQDCLTSWLEVTRGEGRCELCGTKFQFAPKYADGAPNQLPLHEVFLGLTRRFFAKWMPLALRFTVAISLWLFVVPLATAYSYHGWLNRPPSILDRLEWRLVLGDTLSGCVITGVVIVSFLSVMSFAEFLRLHWPQAQRGARNVDFEFATEQERIGDDDIDDVVLDHDNFVRRQRNRHVHPVGVMDQRQPLFANNQRQHPEYRRVAWPDQNRNPNERADLARPIEEVPDDPAAQRRELQRRIRAAVALRRHIERVDEDNRNHHNYEGGNEAHEQGGPAEVPDGALNEERMARFLQAQEDDEAIDGVDGNEEPFPARDLENDRFEPQFEPLDPVLNQEDQADLEVNLALDEMLGFRGPLGALVKNVLWLLAFNVIYLGLFAFFPRAVGYTTFSVVFNTTTFSSLVNTLSLYNATNDQEWGLVQVISSLNSESERLGTTLQLPDLTLMGLGYLTIASSISLLQWCLLVRKKLATTDNFAVEDRVEAGQDRQDRRQLAPAAQNAAQDAAQNAARDAAQNAARDAAQNAAQGDDVLGVHAALSVVVDCAAAFVKVGVLLFLKMFLLPLLLGLWIDFATISLLGSSIKSRTVHAGADLFSSVLIHWVLGITFMLAVTVSVLQLREVVHPGLLARVIRPQEPHPDLLGNLLHDNGLVHAKRMLLSSGIYILLLLVHVWLPARLLVASGFATFVPFTRPRFWYVLPSQFQIPIELLLFHLAMLSFLEKHKNKIGGLQFGWLRFMCAHLRLTDCLIPRTVDHFVLAGYRPVFLKADDTGDHDLSGGDELTTTTGSKSTSEASMLPIDRSVPPSTLRQLTDVNQVDPFWYKLAARQRRSVKVVECGMITMHGEAKFESARTRRNGERVLVGAKKFIRLPHTQPDEVNIRRQPSTLEFESQHMIPTTIGPYRLRRSVHENGVMAIEFWQEVPGNLIARPPDGWDDLGAGGAEAQGRWAWGKERKSTIEEGVAYRKPLFEEGRGFGSVAIVSGKLIVLFILSWFALSVLLCVALSAPFAMGRSVLSLFRISDERIHDPFALGIGVTTLTPALSMGAALIDRTPGLMHVLQAWISRFRTPPLRKAIVLVLTFTCWTFGVPILAGVFYDLMFVASPDWFAGDGVFLDFKSFSWAWGCGTFLLYFWAWLCLKGAFSLQFWFEIANAAFEDDVVEMNNDAEHNEEQEGTHVNGAEMREGAIPNWQGRDGRVERFFHACSHIVLQWEWEKVDHTLLLTEFLVPMMLYLAVPLAATCILYSLLLITFGTLGPIENTSIIGPLSEGLCRAIIFRSLGLICMLIQSAVLSKNGLKTWFRAAHRAARDDRYLVGEELLNYVSPSGQTHIDD